MRRSWRALFALLPLLGATPAQGAPLTALRAGRLVDEEAGPVLRDQVLLVGGERIVAVRAGSAPLPKGARLVDLSAYTVLPGLIDCHTHLVDEALQDLESFARAAFVMKGGVIARQEPEP